MQFREKYSYSKYRNQENDSKGKARVFVAPKLKYSYNPVVNTSPKFWGNVFIVLLIVAAYWLLFHSLFFRISEIIVEDNKLVPTEEITKNIKTGDNIFRFSVNETKKKIIRTSPIIEDVAIYRGIPNALKIVILEKKPVIVWISGGKFYLVDESGIVDKEIGSGEFPELIKISDQKNITVKTGDQIVSPQFVKFIIEINDKFFEATNIKISGFQIQETTFDLYVATEAGFYVKFDISRSSEKQLTDLKNIIVSYRDNIREYVDVRINGWAYYK
jgi:uncharacterized membrane protein